MNCNTETKTALYHFNLIDLSTQNDKIDIESNYLFASLDFIKETAKLNPQLHHHLVEVKDHKESIIAYFYFQCMLFKGKELSSYIPQKEENCIFNKTVEKIIDVTLERINWNLLVLGNVFITGENGQYWQQELPNTSRWNIIRSAANFLATQTPIDAFLITNLSKEECIDNEEMIANKYRSFEVEPDLVLHLNKDWNTFDDYLKAMVSKYRVRSKKVLKNSKNVVFKDFTLEEIEAHQDKLYQLYKNVLDNSQFKLAEIQKEYFTAYKIAFPNQFNVRGVFIENELEGFISYFINNGCLHINFVGLNYDLNKKYSLYHRILYDCVEQGILLNKTRVNFGRTATEIKTSIGAIPIPSFSLLKHSSKLPNLVIKPLTTYLKPEPYTERNPFGKDNK